jgi:hypothetical protein
MRLQNISHDYGRIAVYDPFRTYLDLSSKITVTPVTSLKFSDTASNRMRPNCRPGMERAACPATTTRGFERGRNSQTRASATAKGTDCRNVLCTFQCLIGSQFRSIVLVYGTDPGRGALCDDRTEWGEM